MFLATVELLKAVDKEDKEKWELEMSISHSLHFMWPSFLILVSSTFMLSLAYMNNDQVLFQ